MQKYYETVIFMDGKTFEDTTFEKCDLVFSSAIPFAFHNCRFIDCKYVLSGSAKLTISLLSTLYQAGGDGGRLLVDTIFKDIKMSAPSTTIARN